jgi:hypothetical protein
LGKNLVRPVVETLERRTAKKVEFLNVEACMVFHAADACGYGTPVELKGLTKLFLDDRITAGDRERISAELSKSAPGVEMVGASDADIVLHYRGVRSPNPGCPCEAGRGEVVVTRNGQSRVVLVFTGMKKGVWGQHPAIAFATAVGEALRKAN